jgi:two-component system response regulator AtoC
MNSKDDMIFIVEDDEMYSTMFNHKLREYSDGKIRRFFTGKECIDNLHLNPSLVVLDYQLPDINGLETLKQIKEYNPETMVVALTDNNDNNVKQKLIDSGVNNYFQKSKDTYDRICKTINYLLTITRLKRDQKEKIQRAEILTVFFIVLGIVLMYVLTAINQ